MILTLENEKLRVSINSKGGELWSICDKEGCEYLWQGDSNYWSDRAINLFPYIGRMTEKKYRVEGKEYSMPLHGFVKDMELEVTEHTENHITFTLKANEETKGQYPYDFEYSVTYLLEQNELKITYFVTNKENKTMYFAVGGHPGFMVPLEQNLTFEDYYLEFSEEKKAIRINFSEDCFVTGKDTEFRFTNGRYIPLTHELFDEDAIVLKDMAKQVTLGTKKGRKQVTVSCPDMDYLGFWHMPKMDAPYVCIEPWSSLPSRKGRIEELEKQENLITLYPKSSYQNSWSITIKQ